MLPTLPAFIAGGTIHVGFAIKISTAADNTVLECSAAADQAFGIAARGMRDTPGLTGSDNTVAANAADHIEVYGPGTVAPCLAGAAITRGSRVSCGAGRVIAAVATSNILGTALESASGAGVEIQVYIHPMGLMA